MSITSLTRLPVYAAPEDCDTSSNDAGQQASSAISATDDIVKPQGTFAASSPYAYGWMMTSEYDDAMDSFVYFFYDGTTRSRTVSARVVGSNDVGYLDPNTVDLNPNVPGVQKEVYVFDSFGLMGQFLRYVYDPVADVVTISREDPVGFDWSAFYGARQTFIDEYYVVHSVYPSDGEHYLFDTAYLSGYSPITIAAEQENDDEATDLMRAAYDWVSDLDYMMYPSGIWAYEIRVPYIVWADDGSGSVGAEIVLPVVRADFAPN